MPRFLELLRCIVDTHRVQWVAVFEILRLTATLRTDLEVKVRHLILASTA